MNYKINNKGHLEFAGLDTVELAGKFKTPLYVFDKGYIDKACYAFKSSIDKYYNSNGLALFASKSFCCKEMVRIIAKNGLGLDCSSDGEIYTALSAGVSPNLIHFHGNNKSYQELDFAIKNDVKRIIVDNVDELIKIEEIAEKYNKTVKILFRVKPGIDAHTHDFIRTGQIDSKFGVALETGEALEFAKITKEFKNIQLTGVHCHIGSQIFEIDAFVEAAKVMIGFIKEIKDKLDITIKELDLGGGFGIRYTDEDDVISVESYIKEICCKVKELCKKYEIEEPFLMFEPGRFISGPAAITLYTVGSVKKIPDIREYVLIDGGMTDNPRYALYGSKYDFLIANKANNEKDHTYTVAGKACESGDLLGENVNMQKAEKDDILAVFATGAYNYSMASNYNRFQRPCAIMIDNEKPYEIIKRESLEDLVKNDL